jgi:N-acetylneuraminate lyase/4-hydroxy-tetrahydrodipicolinate synthase
VEGVREMSKFKGIITAILTPFGEDGSIFDLGTINQIRYLKRHGIENVFVCGSYGAFPLMDTSERIRVADIAITECKRNDMKCIVHIGTPSTKESIYLAEHAEMAGADAVSSVVPFYYSGSYYSTDDYLAYFHELVNAVDIDVHMYNNPKTTSFDMSPEFFGHFIDLGIKGIKDGGGSMGKMKEMLDVVGDTEFDYYPSSTSSLITGFLLGAKSCISGVSLSCPDLIVSIYNDMMDGNVERAVRTWKKVMRIRKILGSHGARAIAAYDVLRWRGVDAGMPRKPWISLSDWTRQKLIMELIGAGVDERFPKDD